MLTKTKPDDVRECDRTRQVAVCLADAIIALQKQGRFLAKSEIFSEVANLRVMRYLSRPLELDADSRSAWYNHWITKGLKAYEKRLDALNSFRKAQGLPSSIYSWGDRLGLADCCLIPQLVNAPRMGLELKSLNIPLTLGVFENAMQHSAVQVSHPDRF